MQKLRLQNNNSSRKERIKDVDDLLNRFSVEVVNKQFYLEVAKFFDELVSIEDQNLHSSWRIGNRYKYS
jgi:hypothetical protein